MKKITLKADGTFDHQWINGVHNIPDNTIDVDDDVFMLLSQNPTTKKYNPITKTVSDYIKPFVLAEAQQSIAATIETNRNDAIVLPITSSALGAPHTYSAKSENRNFLNNLITLGNGGKFTCTDADDIKSRRSHTHAQLLTLAHDIEAHISAQFDHYELKLAEIAAATTQAELDAITW
jgi:hypothetical protein